MANPRPVRLIAALVNVSLYFYFFFNELPRSGASTDRTVNVNPTNPMSISVPQSIAQSKIKISIWRDFCPTPIVRVRLVGPEIHVFPIFTLDTISSSPKAHTLEVDTANSSLRLMEGVYRIEASLMRCHDDGGFITAIANATPIACVVASEWSNTINVGRYGSNGNNWAWVNSPKCDSQLVGERRSPECADPTSRPNQADYVFTEINRETMIPVYNNLVTLQDGMTTLSRPPSLVTTSNDEMGRSILKFFSELSNYELVCWLGDDDARQYWRAFMSLYPLMGSHGQRAFKFKYLRLIDVSHPTEFLTDMTYEKCKIFFVSYGIDRFDAGISPKSYGDEVATLLRHIEKSHPDVTYPVWFLSPRSSTSTPHKANSCISDLAFDRRTPARIHAFGEEVHRVFKDRLRGKPLSELRIHLMDNSDITETFWHIFSSEKNVSSQIHAMELQISSAVAMRCMEKIARQVEKWRSINQIGTQHGLMKNGTLIPNIVLFKQPYTWN